MNKALVLENLTFQFSKNSLLFFNKVTLSFDSGTIHFIRGSNGSGKSTLFRILQGNIGSNEIISGTLLIDNQTFNLNDKQSFHAYAAHIKTVQQKFDDMLANQFSFLDNLRLAKMPQYPTLTSLPDHQALPEFLQRFGIDINKPVKLLSGGQRQILAILMVLQKQGKILLLDEPTAALDEQNAAMVMEFVQMLVQKTGMTVLIICHDNELVERYAPNGYYHLVIDQKTGERRVLSV